MSFRILVTDDEFNSRMGVAITLEQWGKDKLVIDTAENGQQAFELIQSNSYDILITDIRMPVMTGLELLTAIRQQHNSLKTILLTGFAEFNYAQKGLQLGAADYLLKPIQQEQLIETVQRLLLNLDEETKGQKPNIQNPYIESALNYILTNLHMPITIKEVAAHVHLNPSYFSVLFKENTGKSFSDYITDCRMIAAKKMLLESHDSLDEITASIGLQTTSYFIKMFKKLEGLTPKQYRETNRQHI
ncbi:MAG: response regulator [Candidatus Pristimantibacillus lignocellulolyticus]|uniref:Response regulator n=1 Tax=Candidatus Pristimantibacillus lignocellulolyticus TaxID=2994561 RepID=A0A9J6ZHM0_9BACL|nr:MAG: response regulator [Candidatus Pristimantibacillus lignocellulolyticus]